MERVTNIAILSIRGAVGTTLAAYLGGLLADLSQRALLIDVEVQPTLSAQKPVTALSTHAMHPSDRV